jgi:hypothetical protein
VQTLRSSHARFAAISTGFVLTQVGGQGVSAARVRYREFTERPLEGYSVAKAVQTGTLVIGDAEFAAQFRPAISTAHPTEVAARDCQIFRSLNDLFAGPVARAERNEQILEAYARYRYSMKAIAEYLGLHHATVSRVIAAAKGRGVRS